MKSHSGYACLLATVCLGCESGTTEDPREAEDHELATVVVKNLTSEDWLQAELFIDGGDPNLWHAHLTQPLPTSARTGWVRFEDVELPASGHTDTLEYTDPAGISHGLSVIIMPEAENTIGVRDGGPVTHEYEPWAPP